MTPFRFGPASRQLYGVFHAATPPRAGGDAVLICNPFGQEAVRFHRMQRVLAERLSNRGIAVLRFDYYGCGESAGQDEEADLASWCDDLLLAHQELQRRSRAARVAWLGVRLGASAAVMASARATPSPARLLLWDPVLDGRAYLADLATAQARSIAEMGHRHAPATPPPITDEALGFAIGAPMLAQIGALRADSLGTPHTASVTLFGEPQHAGLAALSSRWAAAGLPATTVAVEHRFEWTSEEAMNTALVPAPVLELLAAQLEEAGDA